MLGAFLWGDPDHNQRSKITHLKSHVLSLDLKEEKELQDLSSKGSTFQTEGAAIVKDRPA